MDFIKSLMPLSRIKPKVRHPTWFKIIKIKVVNNNYILKLKNFSNNLKDRFKYIFIFSKSIRFIIIYYT
jgi:hypothetical protein